MSDESDSDAVLISRKPTPGADKAAATMAKPDLKRASVSFASVTGAAAAATIDAAPLAVKA
jgi:hypothetical protein